MRNPATPSNMTLPVISLLLPTRGRPALVERFFQSVVEMTAHPERVEVVLYIDEDDCGSHHLDCPGIRVTKIIGPRMTMGAYNAACLEKATGSIIMLVNDDMVIRTKGWDERIVALDGSFPDGIYLVYGNDLLKKAICALSRSSPAAPMNCWSSLIQRLIWAHSLIFTCSISSNASSISVRPNSLP